MTAQDRPTCRIIRPDSTYRGAQGFDYFAGIARETVGSTGICMHLLTIEPGQRARAHKHEHHETAIYVLDGDGQLELFVQTFDHGMDVFTVPGSACNCTPWPTDRGGPLRTGQPNGNDL